MSQARPSILLALLGLCAESNAQSTPLIRTEVASRPAVGAIANAGSAQPRITSDGRFVAFSSSASNLVSNDTNGVNDIFVLDRSSGLVTLETRRSNGSQTLGNGNECELSSDGRYVALSSADSFGFPEAVPNLVDVFRRDRITGTVLRVSNTPAGTTPNQASYLIHMSGDGQRVTYTSWATDIVPNDPPQTTDVFLADLAAGTTTCLSLGLGGTPVGVGTASISDDGRWLAVTTSSSAFHPDDTNSIVDTFLLDRQTGERRWLSRAPSGQGANANSSNATISANGSMALFTSTASNLVAGDTQGTNDVFLYDVAAGTLRRLRVGPNASVAPTGLGYSLSPDGRYFSNPIQRSLINPSDTSGNSGIFVIDLSDNSLRDATAAIPAAIPQSTLVNSRPRVGAGGTIVTYACGAPGIIPGDINGNDDVLIADFRPAPQTYCTAKLNSLGCTPSITAEGSLSLSSVTSLVLRATGVLNQRSGLLAYSHVGRSTLPFGGGTLCIAAPVRRGPVLDAGGSPSPANDCSGSYEVDVTALVGAGRFELPPVGYGVWAIFWSRDPGFSFPNNIGLTGGVEFGVFP